MVKVDGYEFIEKMVVSAKSKNSAYECAFEMSCRTGLRYEDNRRLCAYDCNGDVYIERRYAKIISHFEAFIFNHITKFCG